MSPIKDLADFRTRLQLPFRLLTDPDQTAYRAFALPRGGFGAVAGPRMWWRGLKALLRFGAGKVVGDPYQLPGSFVIDRQGIVRHVHRAKHSADWAPNTELIAALAACRQPSDLNQEPPR